MEKPLSEISKYLSFILRHKSEAIGLELDSNGWGAIDALIHKTTEFHLTRATLTLVVETSDKQRFAISEDGLSIRANQGHSIDIELALPEATPPAFLFHGTAERFWAKIKTEGLCKGQRHQVHLTESAAVASAVGSRYGKLVLLKIATQQMNEDGFVFYKSANNVWLVDSVPIRYIEKFQPI